MFVFVRTLVYSTLFVGFLLVFLPRQFLAWSGITAPPRLGPAQLYGTLLGGLGAALALWCIGTFVVRGRGTPAPFDPPRKLVIAGPYRFVRNPMYIGAAAALAGAALFYTSWWMLAYVAVFLTITHLFVLVYEEPTLRATFGADYETYTGRVQRWMPAPRVEYSDGGAPTWARAASFAACAWSVAFGLPHLWWALGVPFGFPGGRESYDLFMSAGWRVAFDVAVVLCSAVGFVVARTLLRPPSQVARRWIPHAVAWLASGVLLLRGGAGVIVNRGQDVVWDPAFLVGGVLFLAVALAAARQVRPA